MYALMVVIVEFFFLVFLTVSGQWQQEFLEEVVAFPGYS